MSNVLAIARKELAGYFSSPIAYIIIGFFALARHAHLQARLHEEGNRHEVEPAEHQGAQGAHHEAQKSTYTTLPR